MSTILATKFSVPLNVANIKIWESDFFQRSVLEGKQERQRCCWNCKLQVLLESTCIELYLRKATEVCLIPPMPFSFLLFCCHWSCSFRHNWFGYLTRIKVGRKFKLHWKSYCPTFRDHATSLLTILVNLFLLQSFVSNIFYGME